MSPRPPGASPGSCGVADQKGKLIGNGWSNKGGNFSPGAHGKDDQYAFTDGSGPARSGQIALDRDTADKGGYHVGDTVRVATNGPVRTYTLSGIFTTDDGAVGAGGSLVLFDTAAAQKLYLQPGWYEDVNIAASPARRRPSSSPRSSRSSRTTPKRRPASSSATSRPSRSRGRCRG